MASTNRHQSRQKLVLWIHLRELEVCDTRMDLYRGPNVCHRPPLHVMNPQDQLLARLAPVGELLKHALATDINSLLCHFRISMVKLPTTFNPLTQFFDSRILWSGNE